MAIYHLSMKPLSRSSGRSSVAAAAYRSADRLENKRDGMTHDFTRRSGVEHAEIVLPGDAIGADGNVVQDAGPAWARDRSALWNAVEASEKRKDARVAREIEVALPHELSASQRLSLTREFSQSLADQYGVAVDFAIHSPHGATDVRNHHAHLLMTTRKVGPGRSAGPEGLGEKSALELENRKLAALGLPNSHEQVRDIRIGWEGLANAHLARAGLDVRIDHRSHQEQGLEIEPTQHVGVHATQMERRGLVVSRVRLDEEAAQRNKAVIREKPEQVLTLITNEKSVFDRHDIARTLHRYVDGADAFQSALAKVMASPALVELQPEQRDERGLVVEPARYSTREMVGIERAMATSADHMAAGHDFGVAPQHVEAALVRQDAAIRQAGGIGLSDEQLVAVEHITGASRVAATVGLAGAGKSTMLAAAREAWAAQGYQVHGAALAGKAAEGLEEASGIASRTLASWSRGWDRGFDRLGPRSVLVIDEAGMVGSKQLSRFITEADQAGAKLVLVGDPEQLQPIGAGAAFRAVAERVGFVELEGVRRQREDWQRAASVDFGRHRTAEGLAAYADHGAIQFAETGDDARGAIVRDVVADMAARPDGSRLVLAHRRADVRELNDTIRAARQDRGDLGRDEAGGEITYQTSEGVRAFAPGDRILFRENNRQLGVKNGMLGTVEQAEAGRLGVRLDSAAGPGRGRSVSVSMADYAALDHGYATTIHKSQGATVDRAYVLASGSMDRHLTYVAMTRHRDAVHLYAGRDEFSDLAALTGRLARSQAKETTLDYAPGQRLAPSAEAVRQPAAMPEAERQAFGARRGIELRSEIVVPEAMRVRPARERAAEGLGAPSMGRDREPIPGAEGVDARQSARERSARKQGMFGGLKLGTGSRAEVRRDAFAGVSLPARERGPAAEGRAPVSPGVAPDRLGRAVERYARAWTDEARMREQGLPVLEHQKIALRDAGAALEAARPGSKRDLRLALHYDPETQQAMRDLSGPARGTALIAGMEREAKQRAKPEVRANRMVAVWKGLEAEHNRHEGWDKAPMREALAEQMKDVAKVIHQDRPARAVMVAQPARFGITPGSLLMQIVQGRSLSQIAGRALSQSISADLDIGHSRERGHDLGMSM